MFCSPFGTTLALIPWTNNLPMVKNVVVVSFFFTNERKTEVPFSVLG